MSLDVYWSNHDHLAFCENEKKIAFLSLIALQDKDSDVPYDNNKINHVSSLKILQKSVDCQLPLIAYAIKEIRPPWVSLSISSLSDKLIYL